MRYHILFLIFFVASFSTLFAQEKPNKENGPVIFRAPADPRPFSKYYKKGEEGGRVIEYEKAKNSLESQKVKNLFFNKKITSLAIIRIKYAKFHIMEIKPLKWKKLCSFSGNSLEIHEMVEFFSYAFPEVAIDFLCPEVTAGALYEFECEDHTFISIWAPYSQFRHEFRIAETIKNRKGEIILIKLQKGGYMSGKIPGRLFMDCWDKVSNDQDVYFKEDVSKYEGL